MSYPWERCTHCMTQNDPDNVKSSKKSTYVTKKRICMHPKPQSIQIISHIGWLAILLSIHSGKLSKRCIRQSPFSYLPRHLNNRECRYPWSGTTSTSPKLLYISLIPLAFNLFSPLAAEERILRKSSNANSKPSLFLSHLCPTLTLPLILCLLPSSLGNTISPSVISNLKKSPITKPTGKQHPFC